MKINPPRTKAGWRPAARRHMCLHENGCVFCPGLLLEAGPCILCGEDRCIGSRGSASGRLHRCSNGHSFIYESHMHEHSTPPPMFIPSLAGMMVAVLGFTQRIRANPAGGFLTCASRYETDENELQTGQVDLRRCRMCASGCFPPTMLQATACSAQFHMTKE